MKKIIIFILILLPLLSFANIDAENYPSYTADELNILKEFYVGFKDAILNRDKFKVAKMNKYPLMVYKKTGSFEIENEKEFINNYDQIINDSIINAVKEQNLKELSPTIYGTFIIGDQKILICMAAEKNLKERNKFVFQVFSYDQTDYKKLQDERDKKLSSLRGKWKTLLAKQISKANRIDILTTTFRHKKSGELLFTIIGNDKVKELIDLIDISAKESGQECKCSGDAYLVFKNDKKELAKVSYHHGSRLRWHDGEWLNDAVLTKLSSEKIKVWFKDQGYPDFLLENPAD